MPKMDFTNVPDAEDFSPVPPGDYLAIIEDVDEKSTQAGDDMWSCQFAIAEGEYEGRKFWDNIVFSEAAMSRAKLICSRLGIDVSGEVDLTPEMVKDRPVKVTLDVEEYEDSEGRMKKRNAVPFAGYERASAEQVQDTEIRKEEEDIPF